MINLLKNILKLAGLLGILFIIVSSILPSQFEYTTSRKFNVPHQTLFTYISDMNYRMEWHYIKEIDPYAVLEISERDNNQGSQLVWAINNRDILGREFPTIVKQNFIEYQCYETQSGSEHNISYVLESFPDGSIQVDFKHKINYKIPANFLAILFKQDYFRDVYKNHLVSLDHYIAERGLVDELLSEHIDEQHEEEDHFLDTELTN